MKIVQITVACGEVVEPVWLARAETVHRQLRPQLPADYAAKMRKVFAGGGEMCVCTDAAAVLGVAVYRAFENTFSGYRFYVDDLVTDETRRSQGVGHMLLEYLEQEANRRGATSLELESGTQRDQAHKFYFREGMT
ncbi:MAG: N-acetyltransferase family protein, partial [Beijerinckiaceae bacterium]